MEEFENLQYFFFFFLHVCRIKILFSFFYIDKTNIFKKAYLLRSLKGETNQFADTKQQFCLFIRCVQKSPAKKLYFFSSVYSVFSFQKRLLGTFATLKNKRITPSFFFFFFLSIYIYNIYIIFFWMLFLFVSYYEK